MKIRENVFNEIYKKSNNASNIEKDSNMRREPDKPPLYLDVELTNCCNITCNMCPVGTGCMKRKKGFMKDVVFDRICEDVEKYSIQGVRFIRWGEPVLHKNFLMYLDKIKKTGTKVHFNTNGMLLTDNMIQEIIGLQVESVKFSFQGIDHRTYGEMRTGGDYEQLFETIQKFYLLRGENTYPYLSVTTSTTYESEEEIEQFKESIKPFCDSVDVGRTKMEHVDLERMHLSLERRQLYEGYMRQEKGIMKRMEICPELWDKLSINWDGSVSACCRDYDNTMLIGNIMEEDLLELFHNRQEELYRELLCANRLNALPLCKNCYEYIALKR